LEWPVILDKIIYWINQYGYVAIFCFLMFGIAGLPFPEEIMLTFVGYLIFKGVVRPLPALMVTFLGSVCGISLSYFLGRTVGLNIIEKYGSVIRFKMDKIQKVHDWFNRIGKFTLVFGYFIPGVRHFTGFVAGMSRLELPVFARYAYTGAFCWSITFLSLGYILGKQWYKIHSYMHLITIFSILLLIAVVPIYYFLVYRKIGQK
jgi:membrane protein DedA with SNARE-associated domain